MPLAGESPEKRGWLANPEQLYCLDKHAYDGHEQL
jgi:hypothetical protein